VAGCDRASERRMDCRSTDRGIRVAIGAAIYYSRPGLRGDVFLRHLRAMGIRDRPIAQRSPWQNGCAERLSDRDALVRDYRRLVSLESPNESDYPTSVSFRQAHRARLDAPESWFSLIVEVRPPPHMKATRMSMPQGSVIGTHHEIKLVTQDVRAPSLSWRQIASCQTAATCCVAAGIPVGA
jgi:hypothetical protein